MSDGGWWQALLAFVREKEAFIEITLFVLAFAESIILASAFFLSTLIFLTIGALKPVALGG
jgi:hypothetical protein